MNTISNFLLINRTLLLHQPDVSRFQRSEISKPTACPILIAISSGPR